MSRSEMKDVKLFPFGKKDWLYTIFVIDISVFVMASVSGFFALLFSAVSTASGTLVIELLCTGFIIGMMALWKSYVWTQILRRD